MTHEELQQYARRQPFQPFRIVLSTGETREIRHPDLIMVGRRSTFVGTTNDPTGTVYDLGRLIDLLHIVAVDELPANSSTAGNGTASP
jgi:hypothetical protein